LSSSVRCLVSVSPSACALSESSVHSRHATARPRFLDLDTAFFSPEGTPCNEFQIPLDFRFQLFLTVHAGRPYHITSVLGLGQTPSFRHRRHALQGLGFLAAPVVSVFLTIFRYSRAAGSVTRPEMILGPALRYKLNATGFHWFFSVLLRFFYC
jgi:hypothetical protein